MVAVVVLDGSGKLFEKKIPAVCDLSLYSKYVKGIHDDLDHKIVDDVWVELASICKKVGRILQVQHFEVLAAFAWL